MRVVDVNEFYSPTGGGVRTYLDRKMGIMADLGHELIVIAAGEKDWVEDRPGGGRIHWVKTGRLPFDDNYGLFWDHAPILKLLDQLRPDVVETSTPWRPAWTVARWQGDAVKVWFAHNDNMAAYAGRWLEGVADAKRVEAWFSWYTRYMASFLQHYDAFVTNGPALAKRYAGRGLTVHAGMPLGIERGYFSPGHRDETLRAALLEQCALPPDAHLLLGLGRHHPEKRWPMIIDAVKAAGGNLPVGLVLIGQGVDRRKLEQRIAGSPHIRLFRPVYDRFRLARIMASADALIHGSDAEPFGLVCSEALASGLPLIVPDEGGAFEIARPAFSETYRARDGRSAAAAIQRLFAREPAILRAATRHAASHVPSDVDHVKALMAYYGELVEQKRGRRKAA